MLMLWITGLSAPATMYLAALVALALDACFGEPDWLYRRVTHPVVWLGGRIEAGDAIWNRDDSTAKARFRRGLTLTLAVTLSVLAVGLGLGLILWAVPGGWLLEAALAATLTGVAPKPDNEGFSLRRLFGSRELAAAETEN